MSNRLYNSDCHSKPPIEGTIINPHDFHRVHRISILKLLNYCTYPSPLFNIQVSGSLAIVSPQALTFLDFNGLPHERGKTQCPHAYCTDLRRLASSKGFQKAVVPEKKAFLLLMHCLASRTNDSWHNQSSFVQTRMGACYVGALDYGKLTSGKEPRSLWISPEPLRNVLLAVSMSS